MTEGGLNYHSERAVQDAQRDAAGTGINRPAVTPDTLANIKIDAEQQARMSDLDVKETIVDKGSIGGSKLG